MSSADERQPDEDRYGPRDPELAEDSEQAPERPADAPERKPWNTGGWVGLALCAGAFLASLAIAAPQSVLLAAIGVALCITGIIRVYRGRATNKAAVLIGLALGIATFALTFIWAEQAKPCRDLVNKDDAYERCYSEHTGLF